MQTKLIVRELCRDILNLSMAMSEETEIDVYVKYFPHVNEFDVEILSEGFNNNHKDVISYEIDLTGDGVEAKLRDIEESLKEIWGNVKNENQINQFTS